MATVKQLLLDEIESRLDDDDADGYNPPSPAPTPVNWKNDEIPDDTQRNLSDS